jgi:hypothetical protein
MNKRNMKGHRMKNKDKGSWRKKWRKGGREN